MTAVFTKRVSSMYWLEGVSCFNKAVVYLSQIDCCDATAPIAPIALSRLNLLTMVADLRLLDVSSCCGPLVYKL